jgi:uncharacterized repeat protein (TIGR01451 family)
MGRSFNLKKYLKTTKKVLIFSELLVLFLILGSSIAIVDNGNLDVNNSTETPKEIISVTAASPTPKVAPENPKFVEYQKDKASGKIKPSIGGHKTGFVPAPVDLNNLSSISNTNLPASAYNNTQEIDMSTVSSTQSELSAPAYYDLRNLNRVTTVKDQGSSGCCWAFATFGSLESYLMPNQIWDFSENNLKNVLSNGAPEGFDLTEGGNEFMSTAYLARWSGSVDESDDPYNALSVYSPAELGLPVKKHVQKVYFLPDRTESLDNIGIKSSIQNYGALYTSMYYDPTCDNSITHSYYYNGSAVSNHAVAIVGWNDNFDKNNFSIVPPGNGAFIIKNSWGTGYGENGYFYVSYYDSKIGKDNAVFTYEGTDNYENIYQYDPLGWTQSVGYSNPICWCANTFTAKSNETLKAVSFYATDTNCNYEIFIYTNPEFGPINQAGPVFTQSGTISNLGYLTVHLNSGVQLNAGQKFSIVLKLTTSGVNYPIAMEEPISGYCSKATASSGESYISPDGNGWADITVYFPKTNICLKAFTDSTQTPALTITKTANPITYNAVGQIISYNYTVTNSGNVPVSSIAIIDNKTTALLENNNDLAPGSSVKGTGTYTITQADINAGSVTNSAYATGMFGTQTVTSNQVIATVTSTVVVQNPALTITKTSNPITYNAVGQTITYNYTVTNSGDVSVSGIAVTDNRTTVTINSGTLAPGSSVKGTGTYTITQADINAGSVTNSAYATGMLGTQTVTSTPATSTVIAVQNLALTIKETANPTTYNAVGQKITYTFTISNSGNLPVSGVAVTDSKSDIGKINIGTLAPGQSVTGTDTHTITQADISAGSVINTAIVSGTFNGKTVTSNQVTVSVKYRRK